ncbi:MarR family transcriptional regulator [Methylosinus sp. Sm6]|uniref:MarR family transcriptional regulator n=1 Tax=Methylosinus sp. Sm6 TaxID=2866948 RepID=UPI001C996E45|nr:MarR family transcriptional regulator [Methylosinus sp. Sm6]MBY6244079.1 MarR family transcriptional regulator [Methylosinus sp. Sm6]
MEITIRNDAFDVSAKIDSPEAVDELVRRLYLAQDSVWPGTLEEPELDAPHEDEREPESVPIEPPAPHPSVGNAPLAHGLSATQQRVLDLVRRSGKAPTPLEIANALGIATQTARNILAELRKRGAL